MLWFYLRSLTSSHSKEEMCAFPVLFLTIVVKEKPRVSLCVRVTKEACRA